MVKLKPRELALVLYRLTADLDQKNAADMVGRFARALSQKGMSAELPRVLDEYEAVCDRESGIKTVTVDSARQLDDLDLSKVIKALGLAEEEVTVKRREIPELIGGLRARTEDKVIDVSVRRRLADLRKNLSAGLVE